MFWITTLTIAQFSTAESDAHDLIFFLAVIVPLVLAAGFSVGWFSRRSVTRRQIRIKEWAEKNGFHFHPDKWPGLNMQFPGFVHLSLGQDSYACNVVEGVWGNRAFTSFDYHCALVSGQEKQELWFSAVLVGSESSLKPLHIRPSGLTDRISEALGSNEDIRFESREFNSAFHVQSPDRKWASDVIHPRMMEFLLSMPRFTIKFGPGHVMLFRDNLFKAEDFQVAAELAVGILDRLPAWA